MQNIEPDVIRTYLTVAELGSLTSAARQIGKTVAAISYQIMALETAVGQKLFIRHGRGMALSEDGHHFLHRARFLLEIYDEVFSGRSSKLPLTKAFSSTRK